MALLLPHLRNEQEDLYMMELLLTLKVNVQPWEVALPQEEFPALTTEVSTGSSQGWGLYSSVYSSLNALNFSKSWFFPPGRG